MGVGRWRRRKKKKEGGGEKKKEGGESAAYAASELKNGSSTNKLTSPNGEYSTIFTKSGLYIINNTTKKKSLVYSVILDDITAQKLHINEKDGSLYLLSSQEGKVRKILPLGAAADDTCKIKNFVRLTDYGVLIGPPCGTYNTRVFV
jgi:hypothetical protein